MRSSASSIFCHAQSGAKLCMQLGHSGRKGSTQLGWERIDHPLESGNWIWSHLHRFRITRNRRPRAR